MPLGTLASRGRSARFLLLSRLPRSCGHRCLLSSARSPLTWAPSRPLGNRPKKGTPEPDQAPPPGGPPSAGGTARQSWRHCRHRRGERPGSGEPRGTSPCCCRSARRRRRRCCNRMRRRTVWRGTLHLKVRISVTSCGVCICRRGARPDLWGKEGMTWRPRGAPCARRTRTAATGHSTPRYRRPFALLQHVLHVCTPDASFFSKESECQGAPVSSCHVVIARVTAMSHSLHPSK